ncbi:hypothetical protein HMPREF1981_00704 [Bacteroides pyogenes F0041]|uniref:TIGR04150 pseudo-rSAM protein n=1 Tax=Bacteroides pyogenes F0041 TaxID=1321819 RepID=U2CUU1_9BACE|nr:TIGR04150 pseudo-rSAM protein [Bacteroides pyogenes]ERI88320.1 hypothetical protein HMPREF1981_00704 [Bacteroides pyogenes F0041]
MTGQTDFSKPYWFYLSSDVYVSDNKEETKMLLYHTRTGEQLEINQPNSIRLIKEVYEPDNLGVVKLPVLKPDKQDLMDFIETVMKMKMGGLMNIEDEKKKPINLLPILSLSKDVEKLKRSDDLSLIIPDLISYLSELSIYINGKCTLECSACSDFYRQVRSCFKSYENEELHPSLLRKILDQLTYSRVKKINIIGGNIFKYSYWDDLVDLMNEYEFDFHLWANYLNVPGEEIIRALSSKVIYEILVTFPIQASSFETVAGKYKSNTNFHFLIENEKQYKDAINLIENLRITNFCIEPIYTGANMDFFSEHVFLEKEDIFSSVISMREIFRNQKLNANNFGALTILSDGSAKANMNARTIGNIHQDSILDLIYREMTSNSAWRVIRNKGVCSNCLYRFLCPPPSSYEPVIGKPNLCHINHK